MHKLWTQPKWDIQYIYIHTETTFKLNVDHNWYDHNDCYVWYRMRFCTQFQPQDLHTTLSIITSMSSTIIRWWSSCAVITFRTVTRCFISPTSTIFPTKRTWRTWTYLPLLFTIIIIIEVNIVISQDSIVPWSSHSKGYITYLLPRWLSPSPEVHQEGEG